MKSLIMIAHGSKKEKSNNEFSFLVKQIKESSQSYMKVEEAFLGCNSKFRRLNKKMFTR